MARDWVRAGMSAGKLEDRDKFPVQAEIFHRHTYLVQKDYLTHAAFCFSGTRGYYMRSTAAEVWSWPFVTMCGNILTSAASPSEGQSCFYHLPYIIIYNLEWENGVRSVILGGRRMNPLKNKHWIGIRSEPKGEEDWMAPFWRKQKMWQDMDRG